MPTVMQQLLFGGEEEVKPPINVIGPYQQAKARLGYHKARCGRWSYKCCGNCKFRITTRPSSRNIFKCLWIGCTSSVATDIILGGVCRRWRHADEPLEL